MDKILLILAFMFITGNCFAQKISPYYPQPFVIDTPNKYQTQITYFDLNFVTLKLQDYMSYKFAMTLNDDETKYEIKDGKGDITFIFIDKIAINREPRKLFFKYNVFPVENEFVVKELKITGDPDAVLKFFVRFWSTSLNFEDVSKTELVSNRLWQDRISYSFNNGKPYVIVQNTTIESTEKFLFEYEKKKIEFERSEKERIARKEAEEKQRIEKEEAIRDKKENTQTSAFDYQVTKKNRSLKIEKMNISFADKNSEKANLEKKLNELLAEKEKGTYLIEVKYTEIYENLEKTELQIKSYTKPKGLFDVVNDVINY